MSSNNYQRIPSFEECKTICNNINKFSHSTQEIHGEKVHSFKYRLSFPSMWETKSGKRLDENGDDLDNDGVVDDGRINLRGITYDDNGNLLALPFPKFFNNGEVDETSNVDLRDALYVCEKLDGSLISFFKINGVLEIKTMKSVTSEVANFARRILFDNNVVSVNDEEKKQDGDSTNTNSNKFSHVLKFASNLIDIGLSPMFEFVSPLNQIILNYDKDDFVFLGARSMKTGKIYLPHEFETGNITVPRMMPANRIDEYLEEKNVEGVVITMKSSGLMFKMKSSEYVELHKSTSMCIKTIKTTDRVDNIVKMVVDGTIDDVKGILSKRNLTDKLKRVKRIERKYINRYNVLENIALEHVANNVSDQHKNNSRKEMVAKIKGSNTTLEGESQTIVAIVMKILDGKEYHDFLNSRIIIESKEWII